MLEKIIFENFKSFRQKTEISFIETNYTLLPYNVADNGVLKGCLFVGPNASGKSNIIIAIKYLLDSMFLNQNMNAKVYRCIFSEKRSYFLDYYFLINNEHIRYFIKIDDKFNITEKLFIDNKLKMERIGLSAKSYIADEEGVIYDENDIDKETLFLRTLYFNTKFTTNETLKKWIEYLMNSVYINLYEKKVIPYGKTNYQLLGYLKDNGTVKINDFFDRYNFKQQIEYAHSSEGNNVRITYRGDESDKYIFYKRKGINEPIPFGEESLGNQNLLRMLPSFLGVVENGGMLLIDEFSSGFHNDLESMLIKYFHKESKNSQMIFVSHSTNLLSNSLLRPDQEYTVEFQDKNGSKVKRFSTEQPRSAQNIEKMYTSGVFGGLPQFEEV